LLVAAWHLSPELSHKRRKGFRAWAEPCVASIDAAGLGGGATLAEPGPAAGGGVGGPWTVIAIHASTDHRSPSAEAPVPPGRKGVGLQPETVIRAAVPMGSGRCSLPNSLRSEGVEDPSLPILNLC
jgi:hypothetical protein